ncbi:MAG: RNA methyltransferase [Mariprofundus sp.]|nr:RNA methyltransferase [Mariprofundus sp.]
MLNIAVALVHYPVLTRSGDTGSTAITPIDVHDFARSCAFYGVGPVYLVHPAEGMRTLVQDMLGYYKQGAGGKRNPDRREVLSSVRLVKSLEQAQQEADYRLWYTSAAPSGCVATEPSVLKNMLGNQLIVFGTGSGLDVKNMPSENGWLSPIEGVGKVRHLSVRGALAIYLDRLQLK